MKLKSMMLKSVALGTLIGATLVISATLPANAGGLLGGGASAVGGLGATTGAATGNIGSTAGAGVDAGTGAASGAMNTGADVGADTGTKVGADVSTSTAVGAKTPAGVTGSLGASAATGAMIPVATLPNPSKTLSKVAVQSSDGAAIGTVDKVTTGPDGKPIAVKVKLDSAFNQKGKITLQPSQLSFDEGGKIVVASLTQGEINSLVAAQKQTK